MCYCNSSIKTPWCPNCVQELYDEVQKFKKEYPENRRELSYIAAPYNHADKEVTTARMEAVYALEAELMKDGLHVVTPLSMHEIVVRHKLPETFEYWKDYCMNILSRCDHMYVLCLPGWTTSTGVTAEIEYCKEHGIEITYVEGK